METIVCLREKEATWTKEAQKSEPPTMGMGACTFPGCTCQAFVQGNDRFTCAGCGHAESNHQYTD